MPSSSWFRTLDCYPFLDGIFLPCWLIALNKNLGVRPIGVCEVVRHIVTKAILRVVGNDVEEACGYVQKCSGLPAGIAAAVRAMQLLYDDDDTEGILLVDAKNAFNSLNREAALHNVRFLCPSLATVLQNCYQAPSRLIVAGGGELSSEEGITQGNPLSMPFHTLSTHYHLLNTFNGAALLLGRRGLLMTWLELVA